MKLQQPEFAKQQVWVSFHNTTKSKKDVLNSTTTILSDENLMIATLGRNMQFTSSFIKHLFQILLCYSLIPTPIVYIHITGMAHFRILSMLLTSQPARKYGPSAHEMCTYAALTDTCSSTMEVRAISSVISAVRCR